MSGNTRMSLWAVGLVLGAAAPAWAQATPPPVVALAAEAEAQPAISDATITAEIQAKMQADKLLRNAVITIATSNGKVTLVGSVPNQFARTAALDAARGTPGVVLIDDQLRFDISSPTAPAQY